MSAFLIQFSIPCVKVILSSDMTMIDVAALSVIILPF